jgi:hypothetical protein
VSANRLEPATPVVVTGLFSGMMSLQRQTHQQLRAAQAWQPVGSFIKRVRELIRLGHEMPGASGWHRLSVAPTLRRAAPDERRSVPNIDGFLPTRQLICLRRELTVDNFPPPLGGFGWVGGCSTTGVPA